MQKKEKILLVEDNKTLAKLLAFKTERYVNAKVHTAYTFKDASLLLEKSQDFFIALLDLNLPDAPNGEIVDFVLSKNIPVIILTGNIDKETRETFINKDIVDYVFKSNLDDINYIFTTIDRLIRNRNHKIMIVDDSILIRNNAKKILEKQQFKKVFVAKDGREALDYFDDNPDICVILTDYNMPIINGLELTLKLRKKQTKSQLGIIALTSSLEEGLASAFLKHGANDYISKPFSNEELICRVNNVVESIENIQTIGNLANKDFLSGLYNRRYLFEHADNYLRKIDPQKENYAVIMLDIDFFKKVNDNYGHEIGDKVIKAISNILLDEVKDASIIARIGGEEFAILLKNTSKEEAIKKAVGIRLTIQKMIINCEDFSISVTISAGVTFSNKAKYTLDELLEQADKALYMAKNNGRNQVRIYNKEEFE